METLEAFDVRLFFFINSLHHPWADTFMYLVSDRGFWIPFYLFLLYLVKKHFGWKGLGLVAVCIALLIVYCDTGSVHLFKNVFERYRPCHHEIYGAQVHLYEGKCGGKFGFISSHSANFFGLAMFLSLLFRKIYRLSWIPIFACAALVGYSRIYLGVHYPADVAVGALYGMSGGLLFAGLFFWVYRKMNTATLSRNV